MRPYLLTISGAAGLLGLALGPPTPLPHFALAAVVFALVYGLGQALTDVFQTDTDGLSAPYRPLVKGVVTRGQVAGVSVAGLSLCALILGWLNPATLALSALGVAGLLAYTPLKRRWWGGPAANAWIVALLPALGLLAARGRLTTPLLGPACATAFFGYAVFVLLGYLKDVEADRATGYQTLPVRFGRRPTIALSAACAAVAVACSLPFLRATGSAVGVLLWEAGAALLIAAHIAAWPVTRDEEAHVAAALSVRGFVALQLGEAVLARPPLALLAVATLALGELLLRARPERAQV
jgi:4-hydroxybenzoate polyprenyltransferase